MHDPSLNTRRRGRAVSTAAAAATLLVVTALPAWAAESMTITFVRHGESAGNASGVMDSSIPGPHLTEKGEAEADSVAALLAERDAQNPYDGIYWSRMVRTKETAAPTVALLGEAGGELPGVHEIGAGVFEGQPEDGPGRYAIMLASLSWILGATSVPIPGSTDGNALDDRVDESIQTIYDNGDRNAIVFSHGGTIMFWTLMNVENPDPLLIFQRPLGNTDIVVVEGNTEDGWVLKEWGGVEVAADPSLPVKLFVNARDLAIAPQKAVYRIGQAFATGDTSTIAAAIQDGITEVGETTLDFVPEMIRDTVESVQDAVQKPTSQPGQDDTSVATRLNASSLTRVTEVAERRASAEPSTLTSAAVATARTVPEAEGAAPEKSALGKATEMPNRATDLTKGNKTAPGSTVTVGARRDAGLRNAVQGVRDRVDHVAKKITDAARNAGKPARAAGNSDSRAARSDAA
ncbi:histidine phosphatase family protein [Mycobacterium senegalense]|nr:histidine phosphatase family protein [Mycolicibacterium senegalense]QZA25876.1 histidine phosphatase family protein [Mycolicibacterium senegalense]